MPELPEVETVRSGLSSHFLGRKIDSVELRRDGLRFPFPSNMNQRMAGRTVVSIERRAKYILIHLSGGLTWLVHLGMSGYFSLLQPDEVRSSLRTYSQGIPIGEGKHDHVVIVLDDGSRAVYTDPRRFGMMDLVDTEFTLNHRLLANLGPEPLSLDWDSSALCQSLRNKKTAIKIALLDQKVVVGVGNIYACEALFRAKISPLRISATVAGKRKTTQHAENLVAAIKQILTDAIASGGSTLNDFQAVDGELGYFTHFFQVYDREGESCLRDSCDGTIFRILQGGRSTFYCKKCQK